MGFVITLIIVVIVLLIVSSSTINYELSEHNRFIRNLEIRVGDIEYREKRQVEKQEVSKRNIFLEIHEKQQLAKGLPKEISDLIDEIQGAEINYKGQIASVGAIYNDGTVDLLIYDEQDDEDKEINVNLKTVY